ncbi:MAG: transposon-encoded TnpW family protein [Ruminococcus sp.]|nr:transposon-encoded TnpW family protein [Ruminococcus sp.]
MNINEKTTVSEYQIGHTTYVVKTTFNSAFRESLSDVLKRLIIRESENLIGETGQKIEKQTV